VTLGVDLHHAIFARRSPGLLIEVGFALNAPGFKLLRRLRCGWLPQRTQSAQHVQWTAQTTPLRRLGTQTRGRITPDRIDEEPSTPASSLDHVGMSSGHILELPTRKRCVRSAFSGGGWRAPRPKVVHMNNFQRRSGPPVSRCAFRVSDLHRGGHPSPGARRRSRLRRTTGHRSGRRCRCSLPRHGQAVRRDPLRLDPAARVGSRRDRGEDPAVPRSPALLDHERGGGRHESGGADGAGRALVDVDDAALHRPRRGELPRRGRPAGTATVGRTSRKFR
jgi:hypothetical protein